MTNWNRIPEHARKPNFENLIKVLQRQMPGRPTLFEFFLNDRLYSRLLPDWMSSPDLSQYFRTPQGRIEGIATAYQRAGYDYSTVIIPGFSFSAGVIARKKGRTVSMNEGAVIHTRSDYKTFPWPDPDVADYDVLERLKTSLTPGMKLIPYTPDGVLENVVNLVGYEGICLMIHDDPRLAADIFGEVGTRLVRYYERVLSYDTVGACISNDDWGFKTQTMFSPRDMRKFVFPWHRRIVETIHSAGKPAILHSCGHFSRIIEDVISDLDYDGRHSYEDAILPVEEFYDRYHGRIAILGGIDVDFICQASPEEIYTRSKAMLDRASSSGGYALGTGNSVPDYVPDDHYFAMIRAALETA